MNYIPLALERTRIDQNGMIKGQWFCFKEYSNFLNVWVR